MDKTATADASPSAPEERTSCLQQTTGKSNGPVAVTVWKRRVCDPTSTSLVLHQKCWVTAIPPISFIYAVSLMLPVLLQLPTPYLKDAGVSEAAPPPAICRECTWKFTCPCLLPCGRGSTAEIQPLSAAREGQCLSVNKGWPGGCWTDLAQLLHPS